MLKIFSKLIRKIYFSRYFNKVAAQVYSILYPPPYRQPNMEFKYNAWTGISSLHTCAGRQIGENNTAPELYKECIPTEHIICKYEGSRYGLPINITAFNYVMGVWDDTLQLTKILRNDYMRRRGIKNPRLNLRQAYVFSRLGASYPAFLARRSHNSINTLPRLETAFFSVGVTPYLLLHVLMESGDLAALQTEPFSSEMIYEMADASGALISPVTGKGCAGTKKLIVQFMDVMINGEYDQPLTSVEAARAIELIGDFDQLYAYIYASSRLELMIKLNQCLCSHALFTLESEPNVLSPRERDLLRESLGVSFYKRSMDLDDLVVNRRYSQIVLNLLDELDKSEIQTELNSMHVLNEDLTPTALYTSSIGEIRDFTAQRIRQVSELIYSHCCRELAAIHKALGRFENNQISLDDFYNRCSGSSLQPLLTILEAGSISASECIIH